MGKFYHIASCAFSLSILFVAPINNANAIIDIKSNTATTVSSNSTPTLCNDKKDANAGKYEGIVAVVNGDIITALDLEERLSLAISSVGGSLNTIQKNNLRIEILKEMVEEKLKLQCANKFAPKDGWISDDLIERSLTEIATRNNMTLDEFSKFLKSKNINIEVLRRQLMSELSWIEYIKARFIRRSNISQSEIRRATAEANEKLIKESFNVSRMFFPFSDDNSEKSVLAHVNNLDQILKKGGDFADIARHFSKSPNASKGGELGWIFEGHLAPVEIEALKKMDVGSHKIVKNNKGYVILKLKAKKAEGLKTYTNLKFFQVAVSFGKEKPPKDHLEQLLLYIKSMKKDSGGNYVVFMKKAKETGFMGVADTPTKGILEALHPQFREIIDSVPVGGISEPVVMDNGVIVFCVAEKNVNTVEAFTEDKIKLQKIEEQLNAAARNELADLKRKGYIRIDDKLNSEAMRAN